MLDYLLTLYIYQFAISVIKFKIKVNWILTTKSVSTVFTDTGKYLRFCYNDMLAILPKLCQLPLKKLHGCVIISLTACLTPLIFQQ